MRPGIFEVGEMVLLPPVLTLLITSRVLQISTLWAQKAQVSGGVSAAL